MINGQKELDLIATRYERRKLMIGGYSLLNPEICQSVQEKQHTLISVLLSHKVQNLGDLSLLEIGCGNGFNLLELLRLVFSAKN
jgi:hypothetical protein